MRRILFVALLFLEAGCQGLPVRRGSESHADDSSGDPCDANGKAICRDRPKLLKKPCAEEAECKPAKLEARAPSEAVAVPVPRQEAIAQDVLLVPKMVYIPYVAQTPLAPARMTMGLPAPAENLAAPKTPVAPPPPEDKTKRALEQKCQELCDRVILLEKCLRERPVCPPPAVKECPPTLITPACPPSTPILNFFHRPLPQRGDPLQPCEPICDAPAPAPSENIQAPKKMPQRD